MRAVYVRRVSTAAESLGWFASGSGSLILVVMNGLGKGNTLPLAPGGIGVSSS